MAHIVDLWDVPIIQMPAVGLGGSKWIDWRKVVNVVAYKATPVRDIGGIWFNLENTSMLQRAQREFSLAVRFNLPKMVPARIVDVLPDDVFVLRGGKTDTWKHAQDELCQSIYAIRREPHLTMQASLLLLLDADWRARRAVTSISRKSHAAK